MYEIQSVHASYTRCTKFMYILYMMHVRNINEAFTILKMWLTRFQLLRPLQPSS